jgi:hypothetical protein
MIYKSRPSAITAQVLWDHIYRVMGGVEPDALWYKKHYHHWAALYGKKIYYIGHTELADIEVEEKQPEWP